MLLSLRTRARGQGLAGRGYSSRATARPRPGHADGMPVSVLTLCTRALGANTVATPCLWRVANVQEWSGGLGWLTGGLHHWAFSKMCFCSKVWDFPQEAWLGF